MNAHQVAEQMVASIEMGYEGQGEKLRAVRVAYDAAAVLYQEAASGTEGEAFFRELERALGAIIAEKMPPFAPGQHVHVQRPNGGRSEFIVDAVERAFGAWAVKGHFPREAWHPYIYPAEMLEAIG